MRDVPAPASEDDIVEGLDATEAMERIHGLISDLLKANGGYDAVQGMLER